MAAYSPSDIMVPSTWMTCSIGGLDMLVSEVLMSGLFLQFQRFKGFPLGNKMVMLQADIQCQSAGDGYDSPNVQNVRLNHLWLSMSCIDSPTSICNL
jgi:hypothetical protein